MNPLKPFIKLIREHYSWLSLGLLLSLITVVCGIGLLSLAGWFISAAAFAGLTAATAMNFNYFFPAAGVRFFALARIAGRYGERVVNHNTTFKILADLRVWFYQKLEPLAPAYFIQYQSGDLLNRIVSDIDALDNLYLRVVTPGLIALIITGLVFLLLHFFAMSIAWVVLLTLVIAIFLVPIFISRLGQKPGRNITLTTGILRTQIIENLQNLSELLVFNQTNTCLEKMQLNDAILIKNQTVMSYIQGCSNLLINLLSNVTVWLGLIIGIALVHQQQLNGANLALIVFTILATFEVVQPLPVAFQYLGKTKAAAKRLLAITNSKPLVKFVAQSKQKPKNYDIEFKNVSLQYPSSPQQVLHDINLHIKQNENIAIVGKTGSGKTSLINLLARFWEPSSGSIEIGGVNINELSETDLRNTMTIISQKPHIFNTSLRNNLLLAKPNATEEELQHALEIAQLLDVVKQLPEGLDTWMGEHGTRFSGGQIRRLAIARAILHNAPIVIFDEPTEGLDQQMATNLLKTLTTYFANTTLIIITHQPKFLGNTEQFLTIQDGSLK